MEIESYLFASFYCVVQLFDTSLFSIQVAIEIPYSLLQTFLFVVVTYTSINFEQSSYKIIWYSYAILVTLLYYNYLGMLLISLTPTIQVASILSSAVYTLLNLFSGYLLPQPVSTLLTIKSFAV